MFTNARSSTYLRNAILIFMETLIAVGIFLIDLHTNNTVAVACMYSIVIYSWLIPGVCQHIHSSNMLFSDTYIIYKNGEYCHQP